MPPHRSHLALSSLSLRARLILLFLVAAVPLVADRLIHLSAEQSREMAHAAEKTIGVAARAAGTQQTVMDEARLYVRLLTRVLTEHRTDSDCSWLLQTYAVDPPWLQSLWLADATGRVICGSKPIMARLSVGDRPYFKEAMQTRALVVSNLIIGRTSRRPSIVVVVPILDGAGEVESMLVASLDLGVVSAELAEIAMQSDTEIFVADGQGVILAAHPNLDAWVGHHLGEFELKDADTTRQPGLLEGIAPDGTPILVAITPVPKTNFQVAVSIPRSDVLRNVNRDRIRSLAEFLFAAVLFACAVWYGGERLLIRPASDLAKVSRRFGAGDLTARAPTDDLPSELAEPAKAFNEMAGRLVLREEELRRANQRLVELASHDGLTGLANRRHFDERLEAEWGLAMRDVVPLAIASIDVDFFKSYNDCYGHLAGDECLRRVAAMLEMHAFRSCGLAARIGGEEFAILLPGVSILDAGRIAEALREAVSALHIPHADSEYGHVTLSLGVAALVPDDVMPVKGLLSAADEALYIAKRGGRNRVVQFRPPRPQLAVG